MTVQPRAVERGVQIAADKIIGTRVPQFDPDTFDARQRAEIRMAGNGLNGMRAAH